MALRHHCHHVSLATSRTRLSRPSPFLPSNNHLLGRDDWCVVIATVIFMDKCSCRQKVRRLRLRRLLADPLSTSNMKGAPCSLTSWHSTSPSSSYTFLALKGTACVLCHKGVALCSSGLGHGLWYHHVPDKDASVKCLDAVLGKVHRPCWRFMVVRNGPGVVFWHSFSLSVSVALLLSFYIVRI